ncbi:MAG: nitrogen fixation protein NifQ [Acidobacteriaceae bacterium]
MTPDNLYRRLLEDRTAGVFDAFDAHVLACIVTAGVAESHMGRSLAQALGLGGQALRTQIDRYFPGKLGLLEAFGLDAEIAVEEDEKCLRELLLRSRTSPARLSTLLSTLVARRAMRPNHLWQDLGLTDRSELSSLMLRHFAPLAHRNNQDMKWKKFFYRMICRDEGYRLCTAPSCAECGDFDACFGDEAGEGLLARVRLQNETSKPLSIAPCSTE